ncbi:MAG: hypothetical protein IT423_13150 [Pirellulaceae bacterium]|nr:hypothetical protein [Pirellulaceae bacterium]
MNRKSIAPLLIVLSLAAPGCKSGWKMPSPSSMWPWGRQPSAEALAGTPPKPTLESPASKYTPNSVNSVAAGAPTKSATTAVPGPAVSMPGGSLASTKPTYGGAANANGYQTGPYGMSGLSASASTSAGGGYNSAVTTASTPTTPGPSSTGFPGGSYVPQSAYAGTAGLPSATMPAATTPNVANPYAPPTSSPMQPPAAMASMPLPPIPGTTNPVTHAGGSSMPNATPGMGSSMPSYQPGMPSLPTGSGSATGPGFSTVGFPQGTSAPPASAGSMSLPPSSYAGGVPLNSGVPAQGGTGADTYRPGTTGRTTTYNFGSGSTTVPVNSNSYGPSQTSIPVPGSSGGGYGSFQLPPNTATQPSPTTQPTLR